jgi:hypothetical protein
LWREWEYGDGIGEVEEMEEMIIEKGVEIEEIEEMVEKGAEI